MANKYAGVDISYCQPDVDYAALKSGKILGYPVKFAMIRAAYGTNIDKHFLQHVRGCLAAGLYVGVYLFSTAKNAAQAKAEAEWLISTIKANKLDGKITYPIAYDLEMESQYKLGKAVCTAMCKAFMDTIAAHNYQPMLYTNVNWICCHLNFDELKDYPLWLAAYISEAKVKKYITKYDMWQHSVAGHKYYDVQGVGAVPGIIGQCDCNWGYTGFAAHIRKEGKNKLSNQKYRVTATKVVAKSELPATTGPLNAMGFTVKTEEV